MASIFMTGSTGFMGVHLALRLANDGHTVKALCRNPEQASALKHPNIELIKGDISYPDSLRKGMKGCDELYHLAALAKPWDKDPLAFSKANVQGTINVLDAAKASKVKKVVITSTAGVLGYSINGETIDEKIRKGIELSTAYEQTKLQGEDVARRYAKEGMHVVIVNPTRVYGPGVLSQSNSTTKMIKQFSLGKWRIVPGNGEGVGNYVYIDDVIQGHILAMEKGRSGERYILGAENASFNEFFAKLRVHTGQTQHLFNLPLGLMLGVSGFMQFLANNFGIRPLITPPFIRKYAQKAYLTHEKAAQELGYAPVSLDEGIQKTLNWLQEN